jgi:predicted O-methyltransferase YrrM
MYKTIKLFKNKIYDVLISIFIIPSALILLKYKKRGPNNHPLATSILRKIGLFPIRDHYYDPQFIFNDDGKNLANDRNLPAINLNELEQLKFIKKLKYTEELRSLNLKEESKNYGFKIKNGSFENGDAEIYYQILRHIKPKKIFEIGSGHSTQICLEAIKKNKEESGIDTNLTCVEPYENKWLEKLGINIIRKKIEDIDLDWSNELNAGDVLFIDSSHIIRPQGDVLKIYFEIIPMLKPGVIIHIHDIFTPKNYLKTWLVDYLRLWNEQYLMESMLMNNNKLKVLLATNYLKNHYYEEFKLCCPYMNDSIEPSSFYIEVL